MATTIGCIGLGVFGARVAARLGREGFGLLIHDRHIEPVRYFLLKNSADMADNPRMLSALCDVVVSVLPDAATTRAIALGRLGLAEGLPAGKTVVLVDLATTSAAEARALAAELLPHGIHYVEAPARGSPQDAREGKLAIPVGASPEDFERAAPALRALGDKVERVGEVGAAHLMSALVEQVRASTVVALAEASALGAAAGVTPETLRAWCGAEGLLSPFVADLARPSAAGVGHTIESLNDNLRTLAAFTRDAGLAPRHAALIAETWRDAERSLGSQRDIGEIARYLAETMRPAVVETAEQPQPDIPKG